MMTWWLALGMAAYVMVGVACATLFNLLCPIRSPIDEDVVLVEAWDLATLAYVTLAWSWLAAAAAWELV